MSEELSETERETYELIKEKKDVAINDLPLKMRGAVGKLKSKRLVELYRDYKEVDRAKRKRVKIRVLNRDRK